LVCVHEHLVEDFLYIADGNGIVGWTIILWLTLAC
jgi:hypothetical protein